MIDTRKTMCGRFALSGIPEELWGISGLEPVVIQPRFNIAPGTESAALIQEPGSSPEMQMLHWGLVPFWSKDRSIERRTINARAETLEEKPAFRGSFRHHRCLIPATGFYEWRRAGRAKDPYYFSPVHPEAPLVFAGLWDEWQHDGAYLRSMTIITTEANEVMAPVHDRMPVILTPEVWSMWLAPSSDIKELKPLLEPAPGDFLQRREVGTYVNKTGNEGAACIEEPETLFRLTL